MSIRVYKATEIRLDQKSWLLFGPSGAGKTVMLGTFPRPILVMNPTSEQGVVTLKDHPDVTVVDVTTRADVKDGLEYMIGEAPKFRTIAIDSLTTVLEIFYRAARDKGRVEQSAWLDWGVEMLGIVERLRLLPCEKVYTATASFRAAPELGQVEKKGETKAQPSLFRWLESRLPAKMELYIYQERQNDLDGSPRFMAFPAGKEGVDGRCRGMRPMPPIESPTYKKVMRGYEHTLFGSKKAKEALPAEQAAVVIPQVEAPAAESAQSEPSK